jgi:hypothetical protein
MSHGILKSPIILVSTGVFLRNMPMSIHYKPGNPEPFNVQSYLSLEHHKLPGCYPSSKNEKSSAYV